MPQVYDVMEDLYRAGGVTRKHKRLALHQKRKDLHHPQAFSRVRRVYLGSPASSGVGELKLLQMRSPRLRLLTLGSIFFHYATPFMVLQSWDLSLFTSA